MERVPCNDPSLKAQFLEWLKSRIEEIGYSAENPPDYLKEALETGDPKTLPQLIWSEWYAFNNPVKTQEQTIFTGPRGGMYTIGATGYRRYF